MRNNEMVTSPHSYTVRSERSFHASEPDPETDEKNMNLITITTDLAV